MDLAPVPPSWHTVLLVSVLGVLVTCLACNPPPPLEVIATPTPSPPRIDGRIDPLWSNAPATRIPVKGGTIGSVEVTLQALFTPTHIYLLARWPDPTESVSKEQWQRDGISWTRSKEDEDRFALVFPMGNARARFGKESCQRYCHNDFMATKLESERADMWHWKSVRSNPVHQADDKHLVYATSAAAEGGRRGDAREKQMIQIGKDTIEATHYVENVDAATAGPAFMNDPSKPGIDPRFLLVQNAVPFDPASPWQTIPGYVLGPHRGSRGDIEAQGVHDTKGWTLELGRALDTGHDDDVTFDLTLRYPFAVAVTDNGRGDKHSWSHRVIWLSFQSPTSPDVP